MPLSIPIRFTTRCAGTLGFILPAPFIAHPTILADDLVPRQAAIAPYDVTLPLGICLATIYTNSKKFSSLFPEGLTDFNLPDGGAGLEEDDFLKGMHEDKKKTKIYFD